MIVDVAQPAEIADQFRADIIWMLESEMLPGRAYMLKTGAALLCQIGKTTSPREC